MHTDIPLTQDLVFVGGGHAHALVLRMWGMNPLPGVRLTVINPGPTAPYSGMLPGHIAGHYTLDDLDIDLVRLCRFANARLILGAATGIDRVAKQVFVPGHGAIGYDVASIDIGINAQMPNLPGFSEHAVAVKPLDTYAARWRAFLSRAKAGDVDPTVAVIGGGVAGAELSMAMAHALRTAGKKPQVTVLEQGARISGVGDRAGRRLIQAIKDQGVSIEFGASVTNIAQNAVHLADGRTIPSALTVGAAGSYPHAWVRDTNLPQQEGYITVDPTMQVHGDPTLFAVGDCAHTPHAPRPKAGVFAVRVAPVLAHNLRAVLTGKALKPFNPQSDYLKLISLGGQSAMAEKFGFAFHGPLLWRWKDRIDRSFMRKFSELPQMPQPPRPKEVADGVDRLLDGAPLCGGCGAKVGGDVLRAALSDLPAPAVPGILSGPGDDAAIVETGDGFQVISTDHLRAFTHDPALMTKVALIHALGDVWSMGCTPQTVLASVILPHMHPRLQTRTMREVTKAAQQVLDQTGGTLVGGHSTMGAEMTIGFTVTGTSPTLPITQAGAREGDVLLLTKPIGTGVLLAGEMAGRAQGQDIAALFELMLRPQSKQAELLSKAHAMTDVTGFGLAGHLMAMCRASGVGADLLAAAIPTLQGAQALADQGVHSVLAAANEFSAPVDGRPFPLLHDPQTAGGLLAALAPKDAENAKTAFAKAGLPLFEIGRITDQKEQIRLK